jgi:hypothetical protein
MPSLSQQESFAPAMLRNVQRLWGEIVPEALRPMSPAQHSTAASPDYGSGSRTRPKLSRLYPGDLAPDAFGRWVVRAGAFLVAAGRVARVVVRLGAARRGAGVARAARGGGALKTFRHAGLSCSRERIKQATICGSLGMKLEHRRNTSGVQAA